LQFDGEDASTVTALWQSGIESSSSQISGEKLDNSISLTVMLERKSESTCGGIYSSSTSRA
jgi:hypothetical protein